MSSRRSCATRHAARPLDRDPALASAEDAKGRAAPKGDPASRDGVVLLELDGGAGSLELLLRLLRVFLLDALEDGLGGLVHDSLGLTEAERRERAHLLDDLDLLVADGGEDDVEFRLLLSGLSGVATSGGRCGNGGGGSGGDLEGL